MPVPVASRRTGALDQKNVEQNEQLERAANKYDGGGSYRHPVFGFRTGSAPANGRISNHVELKRQHMKYVTAEGSVLNSGRDGLSSSLPDYGQEGLAAKQAYQVRMREK